VNKKAKIADWVFGGLAIAMSIVVFPVIFFVLATMFGVSQDSAGGFFRIILCGSFFCSYWGFMGFKAIFRTERAGRYAKIFDSYPRVKLSQVLKSEKKSLQVVSSDLNSMKQLGYFGDMGFDLVYKEVVLSHHGEPLPQIGDESLTVYEEKRGVPLYSGLAGVITSIAFLSAAFHWSLIVFSVLLAVGAIFLALRFFPAPVYFVEVSGSSSLRRPTATGIGDLDGMLGSIFDNKKEMVRLSESIAAAKIREPLREILRVLDQISAHVSENPDKVRTLRQFSGYYLPTTVNFLQTYEELESKPDKGENINAALRKIEEVAGNMVSVFKQEYDDLFCDVEMDISAEVSVMKAIIKENENII